MPSPHHANHSTNSGYTLLEILVVLVIVSVFAMVSASAAIIYIKKLNGSAAIKDVKALVQSIEAHRLTNLSYKGFPIASQQSPKNGAAQYQITVVDLLPPHLPLSSLSSSGQGYAIRAASIDDDNYSYLVNSDGAYCRNKPASRITYFSCGTGAENNGMW